MKSGLLVGILLGASLSGSNFAQANLVSIGNGLVYDNVANVTWSSDANLFGTMAASNPNLVSQIIAASPTIADTPNSLDTPANSGIHTVSAADFVAGQSYMSWYGAKAFMKYLDSINYKGRNAWMLPTTYDQICQAYNCANSMLGELFYTGLGGTALQPISSNHNASYGLFTNVYTAYWSGTEYTPVPLGAWYFDVNAGYQNAVSKINTYYSWAVLPGNAMVPEPAGFALFGIGFSGLMLARRHGCSGVNFRGGL